MSKPSKPPKKRNDLQEKIIGLGERSLRKSYDPQLQEHLNAPGKSKAQLEEKSSALLKTLDALRESEERYRQLVENSPTPIFGFQDGKFYYGNHAASRLLGLAEPGEIVRLSALDVFPVEYHQLIQDRIKNIEEGKRNPPIEIEFIKPDGTRVPVESTSVPIEHKGRPAALIISQDLTERKRSEEALRESEVRYRSVFENAGTATVIIEEDRVISMANPEFEKLSGYSKEEVEGKMTWIEFVVPEDLERMEKYHRERREKEGEAPTEFEFQFIDKEGNIKHIYNKVVVIPGTRKSVASLTDMTMRRKAEEELRESEEKFRNLAEHSPNMIFINKKRKVIYANNKCEEIMGYRKDEFYSPDFDFMSLIAPESMETIRSAFTRHMNGKKVPPYEYTLITRDGKRIEAIISTALIQYEGNLCILGVISDISDRKRNEEERVRLNTAIEQAAETIVITDTKGTIQYVNPAFERITGYEREEAIGKNPRILKSGKHSEAFYQNMWKTLINGQAWSGHFINRKKDGTFYEEEATISPVLDSSGEIANYVAVKRDVTNEVRLEKEFRQAQKMEAVGTLAGGIAHDFNNLLQAIMGYTQMIIIDKVQGDPELERLQEIEKAAQRASELTQQLFTFSRKVESKLRPVDLNQAVQRVEKLLKRTIPKMIGIELHLQKGLEVINADAAQLEQVMVNLGINARDAMPEGGKLFIETKNAILDEEYSRTHLGAMPGDYVLLTVSDTGYGMEKETLEHIFEPFYTTKEPGQGTGLGLSMVYGIVKNHGGHITCYSEPGEGTTFKIYFPTIEAISIEAGVKREEEEEIQGGKETILLVDDEKYLLNLGKAMLERFGYTVFMADRGESAIAIYKEKREAISLIILDLIMPGIGGKRCLEELLNLDPNARVVISSGFSINGPTRETLKVGAKGFISKPYKLRQMLKVVRGVLDRE